MNFTKSNAYLSHTGTGFRQHQDSAPVPTVWSASDANSIVWSLMRVLSDAGVDGVDFNRENPNTYNRLSLAIQSLSTVATPVGAVMGFYRRAAPSGWLHANGQLVSRSTYALLWALAQAQELVLSEVTWAATGWTLFGEGDGSTTFRLPDLRGEFLRGLDAGRGVDVDRPLGSAQAAELAAHTHPLDNRILTESVVGGGLGGTTPSDSAPIAATGSTGGTETRPRNVALLMCIKAGPPSLPVPAPGAPAPSPSPSPPPPPTPPLAPVANFTGGPFTGYGVVQAALYDTSTNSPASWLWSFGDGSTSTAQNPVHNYTVIGLYTVSLTATNASGSDTETKVNYVEVTETPGGF